MLGGIFAERAPPGPFRGALPWASIAAPTEGGALPSCLEAGPVSCLPPDHRDGRHDGPRVSIARAHVLRLEEAAHVRLVVLRFPWGALNRVFSLRADEA